MAKTKLCTFYMSLWGPYKACGQNGVSGSYMHAVFELKAHEASEIGTRLQFFRVEVYEHQMHYGNHRRLRL